MQSFNSNKFTERFKDVVIFRHKNDPNYPRKINGCGIFNHMFTVTVFLFFTIFILEYSQIIKTNHYQKINFACSGRFIFLISKNKNKWSPDLNLILVLCIYVITKVKSFEYEWFCMFLNLIILPFTIRDLEFGSKIPQGIQTSTE